MNGNEVNAMERLKLMLTGGFLAVSTLVLAAVLTMTTMIEIQPVQADVINQPTNTENVQYAQLTDAQPQRDISNQHFAPLQ
jgi:hypothetical protein